MTLDTALVSHLVGDHGLVFTAAAATDIITCAGHTRKNGDKLRLATTGGLPGGLTANTTYWVRDVVGTTFKLAATPGGAAIDITSTGTGSHTFQTILSALIAKRLFPGFAKAEVSLPYAIYQQAPGSAPYYHMTAAAALYTARVQIDLYALLRSEVNVMRDAILDMLSGFRGELGAESLSVQGSFCESDFDAAMLDMQDASEQPLHRRIMEFAISHVKEVPMF